MRERHGPCSLGHPGEAARGRPGLGGGGGAVRGCGASVERVGNWVDGVSVQHHEGAECPVVGSMLCAFHHNGETGGVGLRAGAVLCVPLNRQLA